MTIHSDWARVLHEECAEAFRPRIPPSVKYDVGVIDGHLQLMRMCTRMGDWDTFVRVLFVRPAQMLFEAGCPTVVMCFDCYDNVPAYKSITQATRAGKHEVKVFHAGQALPDNIPDDAMLYLMNREFKLKVIELVCRRLPAMVELAPGQRLVVDYRRVVAYEHGSPAPLPIEGMESMGESDVKFIRYVQRYGNALVHAIDGDYMPIALLYYARSGIGARNKIFIYRHLATLEGKKPKKRPRDGAAAAAAAPSAKCWVDMQMLYVTIAQAVRSSQPAALLHPVTHAPFSDKDFVVAAVFLMLLAGTDFSRSIPLVGPRRMWDALPQVVVPLLYATADADEPPGLNAELQRDASALRAVARLYAAIFERHVGPSGGARDLASVLQTLQASKLSERTRGMLPGVSRVRVTLLNLRWLVEYWRTDNGVVDTPLAGENGFDVDENGHVVFSDVIVQN